MVLPRGHRGCRSGRVAKAPSSFVSSVDKRQKRKDTFGFIQLQTETADWSNQIHGNTTDFSTSPSTRVTVHCETVTHRDDGSMDVLTGTGESGDNVLMDTRLIQRSGLQ